MLGICEDEVYYWLNYCGSELKSASLTTISVMIFVINDLENFFSRHVKFVRQTCPVHDTWLFAVTLIIVALRRTVR